MLRLLYIILCLLLFTSSAACYEKKLAVCSVFNNDARFLAEWIEYHKLVGVEQFWLYNNNSTDNYIDILKPYMDSGIVKLIHWPSPFHYDERWYSSLSVQTSAYNHCLDSVRGKIKWLAMIGVDDYIVPVKHKSIVETMKKRFRKASGVGVNMVLFGSSSVEVLDPSDLMTERMTKRAPLSFGNPPVYKLIVRPTHVKYCLTPHRCVYKSHRWAVDTHKRKIKGDETRKFHFDRLKIHHYWSRDQKYMKDVKVPQYIGWGVHQGDVYNAASLLNFQHDMEMLRFSDRIKKRLGINRNEIGPCETRPHVELIQKEPEQGIVVEPTMDQEDCDVCGEMEEECEKCEDAAPVIENNEDPAKDKPWWLLFFPEWFYAPADEDFQIQASDYFFDISGSDWFSSHNVGGWEYESISIDAIDSLRGVDLSLSITE